MTRAALLLITILTLALAGLTYAQDDTTTLVPVPVADDELVLSVPSTWIRWDRYSFNSDDTALEGLIALYARVRPAADFSAMELPPNLVFVALAPDLQDNTITSIRVETYPLDEVYAQSGFNADRIAALAEQAGELPGAYAARMLFETNRYAPLPEDSGPIQDNGRDVSVGTDPQLEQNWVAVTYFDAIQTITFTTFSSAPAFLEDETDLPETLLLSLRLPDEDLDASAFAQFNGGDAFPEQFVLGTPEPICAIHAPQNVNMRSGPGTTFDRSAIPLRPADDLHATGQATGADNKVWYLLENNRWVRGDVVVESGACDTLPEVEFEN
ncbi:hypothetical protein [Aggregatilinea lenta]|uniref:hypothetical protein n=1 Tax=Aggregatilinea lenta TaxID=913108 RepID=UPI000E5C3774|nr:hypothetical protein [Aggregatilinea lenta]